MDRYSPATCRIPNSQRLYLTIISFIIVVICLIIVIIIGSSSILQFRKLNKLQPIFKYTFHGSWITGSIGLLSMIISLLLCIYREENTIFRFTVDIGLSCYFIMALLLLMILLFRLYDVFKDSMYEISTTTKRIFIALYCCIVLMVIYTVFIMIYNTYNPILLKWKDEKSFPIIIIAEILYIGTTIAAMKLFANKLMALVNLRAHSIDPSLTDDDAIKLNEHQMKMIENATRYVSLLSLGIFSTSLNFISIYIFGYYEIWTLRYFAFVFMVTALDILLNMICLYLQYSFAKSKYNKYCKCIYLCYKYLLTKKATNALERRYKPVPVIHVNENDENTEEEEDI